MLTALNRYICAARMFFSIKRLSAIYLLLLFSIVWVLSGPLSGSYARWHRGAQDDHKSALSPAQLVAALVVERSILDNIKQNGFDNNSTVNNGLGGLWINWRYGTIPLVTNLNGHAASDSAEGVSLRHDPLTDLRYVHALWLYKDQNPADHSYDGELLKYMPIVRAEFTNAHDRRGWLFDEEFMDMFKISRDPFFLKAALSMVDSYAKAIDPAVGISYDVSPAHPRGYYRVDNELEEGCALIQAGTLFNNPQWTQQGQVVVNFVYSHAYIPLYHTFTAQMDRVLTRGGTANPAETFYTDTFRSYEIQGNMMRMGAVSEMAISLMHTYQITRKQDFLQKARELLDPLTLPVNTLGMWDTTNLGYHNSLTFNGSGPQAPGTLSVDKTKKESGSQTLMLWAFHLADLLTNNAYQNMESQMLNVALNKSYYAPGHGVLYQMRANWTPNVAAGQPADWVTTEAMGSELESLFNANRIS